MSTKKKKPPTPSEIDISADQYKDVLEMLVQGYSWYRAVGEVFGIPVGPYLTALVFRIKLEPKMRRLVKANAERLRQSEREVTLENSIDMINEAAEIARQTADGSLLLKAATERARVVGIVRNEPDASELLWSKMSPEQQALALTDGFKMIDQLRQKLSARGIVIDQEPTNAQSLPSPSLS